MNCEELHSMILEGAVAILARGVEADPVLFCFNEQKQKGDIISLGEFMHNKALAAGFVKVAAKALEATMVGMVIEGWTSQSVAEGRMPFPEGGLQTMHDAVEVLIITIETREFSRVWIYPIQHNDANQRVLDVDKLVFVDAKVKGEDTYNRFSVFGWDDAEVRDSLSLPANGIS